VIPASDNINTDLQRRLARTVTVRNALPLLSYEVMALVAVKMSA
jgi:hypothetical protein